MITGEGFMNIIAMHRSGLSVRAISRKLGLHRKTVNLGDQKGASDEKEKILEAQSRRKIQDLMADAADRLAESGFEKDLVSQEIIEAKVSRAVAIAKTAEIQGYGTIVTGRRGLSVIKDFLMGRVSMKVLHRAHEMAVWIV